MNLTGPLARKDDIITQEMPNETLVYDLKTHKAHCLNKTAALVWNRCDGNSTIEEITERLANELNSPIDISIVLLSIESLSAAGLLEESLAIETKDINRRQMMRKATIGAAITIPLVASIIAPEAAHAATCRPIDALCTTSSQCCSGCCRITGGIAICKPGQGGCI